VIQLENVHVTVRDGQFWVAPREIDPPIFPALQSWAEKPIRKAAVRRRVLVVEDNLDSMHSLVLLLREMGHEVEFAINGYAALDIAAKMRPELIFLDLGLPGLDGFYVCERIKADPALKDARIIAITGYSSNEHRIRSKASGCELHLVKPVSVEVFEKLLGS
jgi:CheY-like chemotaxis protein